MCVIDEIIHVVELEIITRTMAVNERPHMTRAGNFEMPKLWKQ